MKLVKMTAKALVIGLLAFTIVRPLGNMPKLPPIQMLADGVEVVDFS